MNAYASDLVLGGLEVFEVMEAATTSVSTSSSSVGMLDCGATASAAPEAIVRSLISAVLTQDKGAKIELEQSARPYFRFGNGRWGRALCRVHLSSQASGQHQHFSLYALPNPDAAYNNSLDKSSLVPVLIGMDYLGPQGVGMMLDFATGLAMNTKDLKPEVYQLHTNHKGHLVLDIFEHHTKGYTNHEGQAHVVVRAPSLASNNPVHDYQVRELGTLWLDMTVRDPEFDEQELQAAHARMWQLFEASRMTSSTSAFQAQMSGTSGATYPSTTTSSCSNGGILSGDPRPRHGDRAAADCVQQSKSSQGEAQSSGTVLRHHQSNEGGPQGSTDVGRPVAMLQPSHPLRPGGECARTVDNVQCLQRESTVHTKEGITSIVDSSAQRTDGVADAQGTSPTSGQCKSYREGLPAHDE